MLTVVLKQLRENFARVKLFLDLYTNKSPKYLGKKLLLNNIYIYFPSMV